MIQFELTILESILMFPVWNPIIASHSRSYSYTQDPTISASMNVALNFYNFAISIKSSLMPVESTSVTSSQLIIIKLLVSPSLTDLESCPSLFIFIFPLPSFQFFVLSFLFVFIVAFLFCFWYYPTEGEWSIWDMKMTRVLHATGNVASFCSVSFYLIFL
jgi:hypothetical protein